LLRFRSETARQSEALAASSGEFTNTNAKTVGAAANNARHRRPMRQFIAMIQQQEDGFILGFSPTSFR